MGEGVWEPRVYGWAKGSGNPECMDKRRGLGTQSVWMSKGVWEPRVYG